MELTGEELLRRKISNVLREGSTQYWFKLEQFRQEAQKYDFKAQKMMMKIEMSEELQENEVPCLRTIRRLLDYAGNSNRRKTLLRVGINMIRILGGHLREARMHIWKKLIRGASDIWPRSICGKRRKCKKNSGKTIEK
ncbi:MAG: hypothetical protein ACLT1J_08205 [Mediterraneibacter gnavus]